MKCLGYDRHLKNMWSGSRDYSIRVWELNEHECEAYPLEEGLGHSRGVNALVFEESLNLVFSGGQDSLVKVYDSLR